jgi:hypothetical protein
MITYKTLCTKPQIAVSLIGMSLAEFEQLYTEFELVHRAHENSLEYTRRDKLQRRRAVGGGRKHKYSLRDRLLMTLFWLKAYTTYGVLGALYHLDKTTAQDNLNDVLDTLLRMTPLNIEHPQPEIPKLRSLQEVMNAFPELRFLSDTDQQGIE